jgi:glutamyl-tRNA synthetase
VYRGRLAPSPTGFLHLGHARTFWTAYERCSAANGVLVFRNEDLDRSRARPEFVSAMYEDLRWFGITWTEGPDCGGPYAPYSQSERMSFYKTAFEQLKSIGAVYPCTCSRQDVVRAATAPHAGEDEPIYPGTCRPTNGDKPQIEDDKPTNGADILVDNRCRPDTGPELPTKVNWRFRVPDGEEISFTDLNFGPQRFIAGRDFGDFVVWRHDDIPSYQLAVVVDDAAMKISEVVRGEDLLKSTARQLLLYRALNLTPPVFFHCQLVTDDSGVRLAKRHDALSLRSLRASGESPSKLRTHASP